MAAPPMDPLYEQRLREEVIYLHSLWHQGPPRPAHHHHLHPSQPTKFKRKNNRKKPNNTAAKPHSSPGLEWTFPTPPPSPPADVWPSFKAKSNSKPVTLSAEDLAKSAAKHAHQHALKTVADFFRHNNNKNSDDDSDSDSIDSSSSDDDDDESMDEDDDKRVGYVFFNDVFKEDDKLREYYVNNFAKGEFTCLVCGALGGKKMGKKFKGCLALVQHSISIAKTKKRRAHRAFGQTVCKVLGWDIDELSSIVSLLSDNPNEIQVVDNVVSVEGNIVECKNDEAVPESGEGGDMLISLTCADEADKSLEEVGMKGPAAEGLTDEMGSADKKEGLAIVDNVLTLEGKNDEALTESEAIGAGILADGDEGGMNSLTCTNDDNTLEDIHEHAAACVSVTNVPQ